MHAQLFSKMHPSTEAYGCMSTLIMGWDPSVFDPQEAFLRMCRQGSLPRPQERVLHLCALAELSFCHYSVLGVSLVGPVLPTKTQESRRGENLPRSAGALWAGS